MGSAVNLENKIESLENFKTIVAKFVARLGDPTLWEFRGEVIDLGEYGKGKCTCDHPVRYMLLIWSPNGEVAPVGCECIKHFQAYNETLFNKLENARLGLYEALAKEEREKAEALRLAKKADLQPRFELAKLRFLAVCKMHEEHIGVWLPRRMWTLKAEVLKKVTEYKTTNGYLKFYEKMVLEIEKTLGQYERGELK
jgi:hypothetical protein